MDLALVLKQTPHIKQTLVCDISFSVKYYCVNTDLLILLSYLQVVDILRTTELYSPQLKDDRGKSGDPVASDLIGALLSVRSAR